ncbi:MAG: tRNA (adenosine(37)-N6)-dimethylallyltransferase MiaA [Candidatus Sumerlaeia bacterium]|nr:tRNA (adenosine(37)-N6)-dimethylallyltransferase MiaA [Candidatus Sumerlaeia bacterium]
MSLKKHKIFVIAGPTAVGKTSLAIELARRQNAEIISADSMQVYKYLNIGTAKPSLEELKGVPYHLIDFVDPAEQFNVAEFVKLADQKIQEIINRQKIPLVVGGTGLYVRSLLYGIFTEPSKNLEVRHQLQARANTEGLQALYHQLQAVDPVSAARIQPTDKMRIIRALEVFIVTGEKISTLQQMSQQQGPRYEFQLIVLNRSRAELYRRINWRVEKMFALGFVNEVKQLIELGYNETSPGFNALGYKQVLSYLQGRISLADAIRLVKRDTRHYAKRQLTWFRAMPDAKWINLDLMNMDANLEKLCQDLVAFFNNKAI